MAKFDVYDLKKKKVSEIELADEVFGADPNANLFYEVSKMQQINRRAGTVAVKNASLVSGGGKKPWKQKGTGRARQGSIRATQWKGGGKPFGPTPRSYDKALPRQMRREALREAIGAALADDRLRVVESVSSDGKTKALLTGLGQLGLKTVPTLVVVAALGDALLRASRNVAWLTVEDPAHVSVYQLLHARQVVFERAALKALEEALASS